MRISDWSSDMCSSDLPHLRCANCLSTPGQLDDVGDILGPDRYETHLGSWRRRRRRLARTACKGTAGGGTRPRNRKSVVQGKSVSERVDTGGRRSSQKKHARNINETPKRSNNNS